MSININNYEAWFLDFSEGNLSESQKQQLFKFLENHPELKEELDAFDDSLVLNSEDFSFENKESLKKDIAYDELLIAKSEGIISATENKQLETLLAKNPSLFDDLKVYEKLKLKPDFSDVYPEKNKLKKGRVINFSPMYKMAVAAALLFLFGLKFWPVIFSSDKISTSVATVDSTAIRKNVSEDKSLVEPIKEEVELQIAEDGVKKENRKPTLTQHQKKQIVLSDEEELLLVQQDENKPKDFKKSDVETEIPEKIPEIISPENVLLANNNQEIKEVTPEEFLTVKELIVRKIKGSGSKSAKPVKESKTTEDKLSPWDIADASVSGIARITGRNVKLHRKTDEEGNASGFAFVSSRFEFSRSSSKED
jgi:hypothetical protein